MKYNYFEAVKEDVRNYINESIDFEEYRGRREDLGEELNEELWVDDSVTGNGSGSYTFNRERAKENVLSDIDSVIEALTEFCVEPETIAKKFLSEDWEYFDVTARCYYLASAIYEILEEFESEGFFDEVEEQDELEENTDPLETVAATVTNIGAAIRDITHGDNPELATV